MRTVVTGGNGFLGSHLVRRLVAAGHEVTSLQRSDPSSFPKVEGVRYVRTDLAGMDSGASLFEGVDVVFHVAASAGVWGRWADYYRANYLATVNVVNACRDAGVKNLVYTSTPSVVFTGAPIVGGDERMPYGRNWLCHYAHSKALAEAWVLGTEVAAFLNVVALRPHLIWGAGDPHLLPRLIRRARRGGLKQVGGGTNRVDITHVEHVSAAHLLAMDRLLNRPETVRGKAYFLSDGQPVILWQWIQKVLQEVGLDPIRRKVPLEVVYPAAAMLELIYGVLRLKSEPPMTRFVAVELAKDHFFDISAARRDLGYKPEVTAEQWNAMITYLRSGV
jgi:2-alkyl-3-oxoalkanoate reductase